MAIRQQMSNLKHNIRQQQAQLNTLENIVRSGPRPYSSDLSDDVYISSHFSNHSTTMSFSASSTPPSSFMAPSSSSASATTIKVRRRSSHDVLQGIAGPESNLPLPKRESIIIGEDGLMSGVREGVSMTFTATNGNYKRQSSPTRTLSSTFLS